MIIYAIAIKAGHKITIFVFIYTYSIWQNKIKLKSCKTNIWI